MSLVNANKTNNAINVIQDLATVFGTNPTLSYGDFMKAGGIALNKVQTDINVLTAKGLDKLTPAETLQLQKLYADRNNIQRLMREATETEKAQWR